MDIIKYRQTERWTHILEVEREKEIKEEKQRKCTNTNKSFFLHQSCFHLPFPTAKSVVSAYLSCLEYKDTLLSITVLQVKLGEEGAGVARQESSPARIGSTGLLRHSIQGSIG